MSTQNVVEMPDLSITIHHIPPTLTATSVEQGTQGSPHEVSSTCQFCSCLCWCWCCCIREKWLTSLACAPAIQVRPQTERVTFLRRGLDWVEAAAAAAAAAAELNAITVLSANDCYEFQGCLASLTADDARPWLGCLDRQLIWIFLTHCTNRCIPNPLLASTCFVLMCCWSC